MICGDTCSVTVNGGATFEGHKFAINIKSTEENVRKFGANNRFGDWLACSAEGTVTINTYLQIPNLVTGAATSVICTIPLGSGGGGAVTLTCAAARLVDVSTDVDSKGIVEWTWTFKLSGQVTGW